MSHGSVRRALPRPTLYMASLFLMLASQAKFGVPLNTRVFVNAQRWKSWGYHRQRVRPPNHPWHCHADQFRSTIFFLKSFETDLARCASVLYPVQAVGVQGTQPTPQDEGGEGSHSKTYNEKCPLFTKCLAGL